jgi:hypothetical protein
VTDRIRNVLFKKLPFEKVSCHFVPFQVKVSCALGFVGIGEILVAVKIAEEKVFGAYFPPE